MNWVEVIKNKFKQKYKITCKRLDFEQIEYIDMCYELVVLWFSNNAIAHNRALFDRPY